MLPEVKYTLDSGGMLSQLVSAGLVVGGYAYAAKWPTSQIFGRTVLAGADPQEIALTFDDGSEWGVTPNVCWTLLAGYEVRATFFLIGEYVRQAPAMARAISQAGHLVGNHTMTHPSLWWERPARGPGADCRM